MHSSSVETAVGKAISPCNTLAQITPYDLDLVRSGDDAFETAFAFSAGEYRKHFGAQLTRGFSGYLCIHRAGRLQAVCGFQSAETPLFLDQYLSAPAWATAQSRFATPIPASQLVELGGFAVRKRALDLPFMAALAPALLDMGFSHAVATATIPVRRCLSQVGVTTQDLGAADPVSLHDKAADWGTYYSMRPRVVAGSISQAVASLAVQLTC